MSEFDELYGVTGESEEPAPVAPPAERSEFDELYDEVVQPQVSTSKLNLQEGQSENPDDFAQRRSLSRQLAVPVNLLPPTPEAQAELVRRLNSSDDIAAKAPALSKWLQSVDNAKLIGGDARSLRRMEDQVRKIRPTVETVTRGVATSFKESFTQMKAGAKFLATEAQFRGTSPGLEQRAVDVERLRVRESISRGELTPRWSAKEGKFIYVDATGVPADLTSRVLEKRGAITSSGRLYEQKQKLRLEAMHEWAASQQRVAEYTPDFETEAGQVAYEAVSGTAASVPLMAASIAAPGASVLLFGGSAALQAAPKYALRDASSQEVSMGAGLEGLSAGITNMLPLGYIVKHFGKKGLGLSEFFAETLGREVPTEMADTLAASIVDTAVANPDKTWAEMAKELPHSLAVAATGALVMSGALGGVHKGAQLLTVKRSRADDRIADQETLAGFSKLVVEEPLRERDSEAFREFMREMDDGTGISDLYISVDDFVPLTQSTDGASVVAAIPGLAEQIAEAQLTNGTVRVTLADYATHIAGSGIDAALLPKIRTSPDGYTYDEAHQFFQEAEKELRGTVEQVTGTDERVLTRDEFEQQQAELVSSAVDRRVAPRRKIVEEGAPVTSSEFGKALEFAEATRAESKTLRERGPERRTVERRVDSRARDMLQKAQASGEYSEEQVQKLLELARAQPTAIREQLGAARVRLAVAKAEELPAVQAEVTALENQLSQRATQVEAAATPTPEQQAKRPKAKKAKNLPKTYEEYLASHPSKKAVIRKDAEGVEEKIVEQFVRSGRYTQSVSKLNAFAIREAYVNMASRLGILPSELYARYPLSVTPDAIPGYSQEPQDVGVLVNVGLARPDGGQNTEAQVLASLKASGADVLEHAVHASDTEQTVVAKLVTPLTPEAAEALSRELGQEAIVQIAPTGGALYGPEAAKWGAFNPKFFLTLDGKRLNEVLSVSVTGVHFSQAPRDVLKGEKFGTGLTGAERKRLKYADDKRLHSRIAFYVDEGQGVFPEQGVGRYRHEVQLTNLYDGAKNPLWFPSKDPNEFETAVINAGYSGYYVRKGFTKQGVAVLLGDAAKEVRPALKGEYAQLSPGFYSGLERALTQAKQTVAPAKDWLAIVQKLPGVKKEELEWSGVLDWLAVEGTGKVTREQIAAFVRENGVEVHEEILSGDVVPEIDEALLHDQALAIAEEIASEEQEAALRDFDSSLDFEIVARMEEEKEEEADETFYVVYTGGRRNGGKIINSNEDYRYDSKLEAQKRVSELRDKAQEEEINNFIKAWYAERVSDLEEIEFENLMQEALIAKEDAQGNTRWSDNYVEPGGHDHVEIPMYVPNISSEFTSDTNHYGDVGGGRVVAWLRANTRDTADGKSVLFIEEIQSKRAQEGREKGIIPRQIPEVYTVKRLDSGFFSVINAATKERHFRNDYNSYEVARIRADEANREAASIPLGAIGAAPFIEDTKSWTALALKRAMIYAAEQGLDGIAWTTGAQQNRRYSLSTYIKSITYYRNSDGGWNAQVEKVGWGVQSFSWPDAELDATVGKELAEKMRQGDGQEAQASHPAVTLRKLSGLDLEVGGEGMRGFYDKIVPNTARGVLKGLAAGGEVGSVSMQLGVIRYGKSTWHVADQTGQQHEFVSYKDAIDFAEGIGLDDAAVTKTVERELDIAQQQAVMFTDDIRRAILDKGFPLFQGQRGAFNPATLTMSFLKASDLSTPLHESGHFYLELLAGVASGKDAPAEVAADFDKVLNWFGVTREQWDGMTLEEKRPYHEQWAESYELYLFENKAPSRELRPIFARFSVWLTQVYKSIKNFLDTHPAAGKLNDEIRSVFDRMLASADAIEDAEQTRWYEKLFGSAAEAGVSAEDYAKYSAAGVDGTAAAVADLRARSLKDMKWLDGAKARVLRALQKDAKAKRDAIRAEVEAEIAAEPIERARMILKDASSGVKLDTTIARELLPDLDIADLRGMTHAKDGTHPDQVAEMLGFDSGIHLITELIDAEPTASKIEGRTDQRMIEEHGELVDDRSIAHAVNLAVHNEARARFLASGLTILTKSQVPASQLAAAAKAAANAAIGARKIRDVRPAQYEAAEAKANKDALANAAKNPEKAIAAQRAALLNNRLARSATDALTEVDKGIAHFAKLQNKASQDSMRGDFLIQLNALLARFDLRTSRTLKQIDEEKDSLATWVEAESERLSAIAPDLPAWILDDSFKKHYKDMTVDEFRGLVDAVKALELLARREETQYQAIRDMKFSDERAAILNRVREFNPAAFTVDGEPRGIDPKFIPKLFDSPEGSLSEKFQGEFLNAETIANMLEGGEFGQLNESLIGRLSAGVDRKASRLAMIYKQLKPLFDAYSFKEKRDFSRKQLTTIGGTAVTRENVVVVALLHGNAEGRERLANYGWSEAEQTNAINALDGRDLDLVEGIWKLFDKDLWPELKALNNRTRGKAPPKVMPLAYTASGRPMTGGYFRLKYDTNLDERAHKFDEGAAVKDLLGGSLGMSAKTAQGTSTERKQGVTMRPRLDLGVLSETVSETVHDLELREAVADTMRLLNDTGIRNAIKNAAGVPSYRALVTRVREIAAPPRNPSGFIEKALTLARKNTIVTLMSGIGTALQNVTGVAPALVRVPVGRLISEFAKYYSPAMRDRFDFVMEQSKYMRNRYASYDRDLQSEASKLTVNGKILPDTATFLWFMGQVDKGISVPVWSAAFADGLQKFENDQTKAVDYADHIVRQTQGSGRELDLAAIMSGHGGYGQLKKVFTMFYSYFNAQLGALVRAGAVSKRLATDHPALAAALFTKNFLLIYVVPAVVTRMIFAGHQEDDEDWMHKYGVALAKYGLGMVPIVRDVGTYAMSAFDSSLPDYGMKVTAVQAGLEGVVKGAVAIKDIATGEGTDRDTKNAILGISYAVGLPGNLIYNTTSGVYEWLLNDGPVSDIIYGYKPTE